MSDVDLQSLVDGADGPTLLLCDDADAAAPLGRQVTIVPLDGVLPRPRRWVLAVASVADPGALRILVSGLPPVGRSRRIAVHLSDAVQPLLLRPRAEWPRVSALQARTLSGGGAVTVVEFMRPAPVASVLAEFARTAGWATQLGRTGVVVAMTDRTSAFAGMPALDASDDVVPPDVVLSRNPATVVPKSTLTGRRAVVVDPYGGPAGPVDEAVLNPAGFEKYVDGPSLDLRTTDTGDVVLVSKGELRPVDPDRGVTAAMVRMLRGHHGVRVIWSDQSARATAFAVAGLAAAGVPVVAEPPPESVRRLLTPALIAALTEAVDLRDPLRREEHSVRLRRVALTEHSARAWRSRLAAAAGLTHPPFPTCSVLLATKRPENLDFALRQVLRQRGVSAELVLATHGFEPDPSMVRDRMTGMPVTVLARPETELFGDVLTAAVDAATGDVVVKMDDDDWYGPDFLADLLLARQYSGADVVGTTAEFVYLEEQDVTVRRNDEVERLARFVAGGSLSILRSHLRELGGFRSSRRFVDASLLAAVRSAGGRIYRTHGLGYVLRRRLSGHTWSADAEFFLDTDRLDQQWPGFTPSVLLEPDPADLPR